MVDDIVFNIDALHIILESLGVNASKQVHEAYNGEQAVTQVTSQEDDLQYDLILCDCNMPVMDGY